MNCLFLIASGGDVIHYILVSIILPSEEQGISNWTKIAVRDTLVGKKTMHYYFIKTKKILTEIYMGAFTGTGTRKTWMHTTNITHKWGNMGVPENCFYEFWLKLHGLGKANQLPAPLLRRTWDCWARLQKRQKTGKIYKNKGYLRRRS